MKPGLARAVPMGIIGFLVGGLLAYIIRLAQGLEPNAAAPYGYVGPAMVLGAFISSFFFIWGMGAFDPRMNVHGEEHEHADEDHAEEDEKPVSLLSGFTWQILFGITLLVLGVAIFAFLPFGPTIQSVRGDGDPASIHWTTLGQLYTPLAEFVKSASGLTMPALAANAAAIQISYLVLFILFVLLAVVSLFVVAGLLAFLLTYLAAGRRNPDQTAVPWRAIILVLLLLGLTQFPILTPAMTLPMILISPIFILPVLALAIAYRNLAVVLLAILVIPVILLLFVAEVSISQVWIVYNLIIVLFIEILVLQAVKSLVAERLWLIIATAVFTVTLAAALVLTVAVTQTNLGDWVRVVIGIVVLLVLLPLAYRAFTSRQAWANSARMVFALATLATVIFVIAVAQPEFWQLLFLVLLEVVVALLMLPVPVLRNLVPRSVWEHFAAVRWPELIPGAARTVNRALRTSLPQLLGQR